MTKEQRIAKDVADRKEFIRIVDEQEAAMQEKEASDLVKDELLFWLCEQTCIEGKTKEVRDKAQEFLDKIKKTK